MCAENNIAIYLFDFINVMNSKREAKENIQPLDLAVPKKAMDEETRQTTILFE